MVVTEAELHRVSAELRFTEGLRRRSAEARAEATIREACALAHLEGARIDPQQLREQIMTWDAVPAETRRVPADLVVGLAAWRATWFAVSALPDLNPQTPSRKRALPLRSLLAGIQRDYASVLAAWGMADSRRVSIPRDPERWGQILSSQASHEGDALTRAARLWGHLLVETPFEVGNSVVGVVAAKHLLAWHGVEPTAVSILSLLAAENPGRYREAVEAVRSGMWDPWVQFARESVIRGCREGLAITRHVQAATLQTPGGQ